MRSPIRGRAPGNSDRCSTPLGAMACSLDHRIDTGFGARPRAPTAGGLPRAHCTKSPAARSPSLGCSPACGLDVDAHVHARRARPIDEVYEATGPPSRCWPCAEGAGDRPGRGAAGLRRFEAARRRRRHVLRLRRRLRELEPDIVHTNSLKAALYGGVAARLAGVPLAWHIRDRIADDYLPGAGGAAGPTARRRAAGDRHRQLGGDRGDARRARRLRPVHPSPVSTTRSPRSSHQRSAEREPTIGSWSVGWRRGRASTCSSGVRRLRRRDVNRRSSSAARCSARTTSGELQSWPRRLGIRQRVVFTGSSTTRASAQAGSTSSSTPR